MSIVAALDKVLFFNASSKYSVLRMKTEDSSVPAEARSQVLHIHGRHDPCIVPRAVPCMEAAAAIAIFDALAASGTYRR